MKKAITASNNLVLLQKEGQDEKAKQAFSKFVDKDKKAILNTIEILHGNLFCKVFID